MSLPYDEIEVLSEGADQEIKLNPARQVERKNIHMHAYFDAQCLHLALTNRYCYTAVTLWLP